MPGLLGVLETCLYVEGFERACPFYEQVLGLNSIYRDARLCAYDVGGRGVLLLFLRGASLAPTSLPGGTVPPHDGHGPLHFAVERRAQRSGVGCPRAGGIAGQDKLSRGCAWHFPESDEQAVNLGAR